MADPKTSPDPSRSFSGWLKAMPGWKKALVAGATLAAAAGGVLSASHGAHPPTGESGAGAAFVPGLGGGSTSAAPEPASKGVFRLGFSFLAGFCIGSFIRTMVKVASIALGFWLFMTFLLSYFGLVNVDWNAIQTVWDRFAAAVEHEWGDFQRFMTGSLPAAGLALLGLSVGLKRH